MNSNCGEAVMTPNHTLFARVLIARITSCKNMITSVNVKIKLDILMNPTDRTSTTRSQALIKRTGTDTPLKGCPYLSEVIFKE